MTGLAVGLPLQLILVANLPVGQTFTGDPTSATVAAVAARDGERPDRSTVFEAAAAVEGHPDNVAAAVAATGAFGVDASSRLEAAVGRKDAGKVAAFVQEAKRT